MNAKSNNAVPTGLWRLGMGGVLLAAGSMFDLRMTAATSVINDQVPQPPLQTQDQLSLTNEMQVFQPAGPSGLASQNAPPLPQIFQSGPVQLHPHLDYEFSYGNGIEAQPGVQATTAVQQISPGITADLGSHWILDYTPTLLFYSSDKFQNGVDHSVSLTGGEDYEDWKFGFSHSSQFTSTPLVETGAQTDQSTHVTGLTASHDFSSHISADFGVSQDIALVSGLDNSYDWSTMDWINYKFNPRLSAGLGAGAGYDLIEGNNQFASGNSDQTYEDLESRINWRLTKKISFQLSGGLEDRQFSTAGTGDSLNPIFSATVQYEPIKGTEFLLVAGRTVSSSDYYLAAQETKATSFTASVNQQLFRKFTLEVGVGYSITDYTTPSGFDAAGSNRSDDSPSFNVRLSHPFLRRGTWSVFYQYADNDSTETGYSFHNNMGGIEVGYRF